MARIGMNYFDGWADQLSNVHFDGLVRPGANGQFPGREPLSGWRDNTPAAMRASLTWAHADGVGFFYFDWYFDAPNSGDPSLNTALANYWRLRAHDGVGAALMYVNADPFVVSQADWQSTVEQWVTQDFTRPDYARIDGKPVLFIYDSARFTEQWGGTAGVNTALDVLRQAAVAHGLPGVFVVGSIFVGTCVDSVGWNYFGSMIKGQSWDALSEQGYPAAACERDGAQPYSDLVAAGGTSWDRYASSFDPPTIPDVMAGWDPRPWDERPDGHLWWFERTPAEFSGFVHDAVNWVQGHPTQQVEHDPAQPLVLVTSWNELGEGMTVMPSRKDGYSYGQALAEAVGLPRPIPIQNTLSIASTRGGAIKASPHKARCSHSCRAAIDYGQQVILYARPRHGFTFHSWRGGCKGRNPTCSFIIEHDTSVRATFTRSH
jgi:hypothetical protein